MRTTGEQSVGYPIQVLVQITGAFAVAYTWEGHGIYEFFHSKETHSCSHIPKKQLIILGGAPAIPLGVLAFCF